MTFFYITIIKFFTKYYELFNYFVKAQKSFFIGFIIIMYKSRKLIKKFFISDNNIHSMLLTFLMLMHGRKFLKQNAIEIFMV